MWPMTVTTESGQWKWPKTVTTESYQWQWPMKVTNDSDHWKLPMKVTTKSDHWKWPMKVTTESYQWKWPLKVTNESDHRELLLNLKFSQIGWNVILLETRRWELILSFVVYIFRSTTEGESVLSLIGRDRVSDQIHRSTQEGILF